MMAVMSAPIARFKDLSIDAVDPLLLGRVLGRGRSASSSSARDDDMVQLTGPTPQSTVWLNRVPEPVTVKQRVHLDVHVADVDDAARASGRRRWTSTPSGGRCCATRRAASSAPSRARRCPAARLYEVVVDCADPAAQAAWWAGAIGGRLEARRGARLGRARGDPGRAVRVPRVRAACPEPKTVKNRIHWDVDHRRRRPA